MQGYSPKLPLQKDPIDGVFSMNKTALESIKQDIKMLMLTNPGERMMMPDYGVGLRQLLFSQKGQNLNNEIINKVKTQIKKYMSFVTIISINVLESEQSENTILVNINFTIPSLNKTEELNLALAAN